MHQEWQPSGSADPQSMHSPYVPRPPGPTPIQHHDSGSGSPVPGSDSTGSGSQPSLMRTTQLGGAVPSPSYNPYAASNSKAALVLQQDLNLMAVGWQVITLILLEPFHSCTLTLQEPRRIQCQAKIGPVLETTRRSNNTRCVPSHLPGRIRAQQHRYLLHLQGR